jgi:NAD(P)-dependent dehydrogenase (short-subunit alcohol dehydrogenase family)
MRGSDRGSIINTGSFLAGMGAATAQTAFSAAKAAVIHISRDLGTHLAKTGVRVNSLSIGPVESALSRSMSERLPADATTPKRLSHVPTGRFATPAEIAGQRLSSPADDSALPQRRRTFPCMAASVPRTPSRSED